MYVLYVFIQSKDCLNSIFDLCKCFRGGSIPRTSGLRFAALSTTPQGRGFSILKIRAIWRYQDFEDWIFFYYWRMLVVKDKPTFTNHYANNIAGASCHRTVLSHFTSLKLHAVPCAFYVHHSDQGIIMYYMLWSVFFRDSLLHLH